MPLSSLDYKWRKLNEKLNGYYWNIYQCKDMMSGICSKKCGWGQIAGEVDGTGLASG